MRAIVKDAVNCKAVAAGQEIIACQGMLPEIALQVTTIGGSKQELVLRNEDYNSRYIEFQPIDYLSTQGIQLLLGDTFLRKYYTEFNYKDRQLNFALRVKQKGDFVYWILLVGALVLVLGALGCFLAHRKYDAICRRGGQRLGSTEDPQPAERGIVYNGQYGTETRYTSEVEQPRSAPAPIASNSVGYRLSDGQQQSGRGRGLVSGIVGRLTGPSRPTDAKIMREQREKLLSNLEQKDADV